MKCLVTGAAGFICSHLSERLLQDGHDVTGLDTFTDYYDITQKRANLTRLSQDGRLTLIEADMAEVDLAMYLQDVQYVFHLAGQPGVRASWGSSFDIYLRNNILATQRLLEAAKNASLLKLVYASSSSVYGDAESFPTAETALPKPVSPYGVSKLAAEHLCHLYWKNYGVPAVSVRYFTVYGPRQRPDMAFHKFVRAAHTDQLITIFGDGEQTRDFTFVADAVDGTARAAFSEALGESFNIGGGSRVTVNQILATLEDIHGRPVKRQHIEQQDGDVRHTSADTTKARQMIGYAPQVDLATGLRQEYLWARERYAESAGAGR